MPNWTPAQLDAINLEGSNILVSASAGSGKTAVLTERVIRKLKAGISIDQLLILTFTRLAAYEMKERIRKAMRKEPSLKAQLPLLDAAYITTFDSYALSVVRKYHYLLNVRNDLFICDEFVLNLHANHCLEQIFERLYQEEDPDFTSMIGDLCVKDDQMIKEQILNIYQKMELRIDKDDYLNTYLQNNYQEEAIESYLDAYLVLIHQKIEGLTQSFQNLMRNCDDNTYLEKLAPLLDYLNQAKEQEYHVIKDTFENIKLPNLPKGSTDELKAAKERFQKELKQLSSFLTYESKEEMKTQLLQTKSYATAIIKILQQLDQNMKAFKAQQDMYAFIDIAKMAIQIVRDFPSIQDEIKHRFQEIMIDEYQDTSDLQEAFISYIANQNVFMVGDYKQSIYRFRNANPDLFRKKYEQYAKGIDGIKIDLNHNFRSRREVIEDINAIFNRLMNERIGGANYPKDHQMSFGNAKYTEFSVPSQDQHISFYDYQDFDKTPYKPEEMEAFIIAKDIETKIKNNFQVYDKELDRLRTVQYQDFVILMDRGSTFDVYKQIFEYCHIPLIIQKDEILTNAYDVYLLKNIMKFVIKIKRKEFDKEFKYVFTSIARSFLFSLSDQEIFSYFVNDNFTSSSIFQKGFELSRSLQTVGNQEFLEQIINTYQIYERLPLTDSIEAVMIRIEYLNKMAKTLSQAGYDVFAFVGLLEEVLTKGLNITYSLDKNGDCVKIMSIHKSKGLEFPICYYSGLYKKFNQAELKEYFCYDPAFGLICPIYEDGIKEVLTKELFRQKYDQEELSEKVRLFYVALTRAKEKMIIISCQNENQSGENDMKLVKYHSFFEMVQSLEDFFVPYTIRLRQESIQITDEYKKSRSRLTKLREDEGKKLTVKELNIQTSTSRKNRFSKVIGKRTTEAEIRKIELGKKLHYLLETIDFHHPEFDKLQVEPFFQEKIEAFLQSDLMKHSHDAQIIKEYAFIDQGQIGIIDLLIIYPDHIDLVDYKLKQIDDESYLKQLKGYQEFIAKKTNKKVFSYLYSILDGVISQV